MERKCDRCKAVLAPGRPRVRVGGQQLWCQTCAKRHGASGAYEPGSDIAKAAHFDPTDEATSRPWRQEDRRDAGTTPSTDRSKDIGGASLHHLKHDHRLTNSDELVNMSQAELAEQHERTHAFEERNRGTAMEKYMPPLHDHTRRRFDPHSDGAMHSLNSLEPRMAIKIALREQKTGQRLFILAHDSGDGQTIYHCPFCGSGQVIARSDRTIECEFCHTSFTVQVQPEYSAFPQTMDGQPVQVPGMPGQIGVDPSAAPGAQPGDPNADADGDGTPNAMDADFDPANPASSANQPPWLTAGLRTSAGKVLPVEEYVRHLALKHAAETERPDVLRAVRASRGQ